MSIQGFTGDEILALAYARANVDSGNVTSTNQLGILNEALREYTRDLGGFDANFNLTTASSPALVAGTQEYSFPTGAVEVDEWQFVAYRRSSTDVWTPLAQISHSEARLYDQDTGQPWAFYQYYPAGVFTVGIVPKPSAGFVTANVTIRFAYRYKPAEMTATSDTILLPRDAKSAIMFMVAAEFAVNDNNPQLGDYLKGKAREEKAKAAENLLDQTLSEINIAPQVFGPNTGFAPTDRRFWGL